MQGSLYPKNFLVGHNTRIKTGKFFVLMPFDNKFLEVYDIIKKTIESEELNMSCLRSDDFTGSHHIIENILSNIIESEFIIADLTDKNPNVFYELGIAHMIKDYKKVILLTQNIDDVPFDLRQFNCIVYEQSIAGCYTLKTDLVRTIKESTPAEFRTQSSLSLKDADWEQLLYSIDDQTCTPFIGAGACSFPNTDNEPWLPSGSTVSKKLSKKYEYPLDDSDLLDRVSQYVAIQNGDMVPKMFIARWLKGISPPDFSKEEYKNTPHAILADLKLPIYITTNYDEFMESALKSRGRIADSEFCKWNEFLKKQPTQSVCDKAEYKPTPDKPLVYHLHGDLNNPRSMVLTEIDYLDFLINLSREEILSDQISQALDSTSLLFVGYSLRDINFRFIFRSLMQLLGEGIGAGYQLPSISVQLPSGFTEEKKEQGLKYLDEYSKNMFKVRVYWGDANEFSKELRDRWQKFKNAK